MRDEITTLFLVAFFLMLCTVNNTALAYHTKTLQTISSCCSSCPTKSTGYLEISLGRVFNQQVENSYLFQEGFPPDLYFSNHLRKTTLLTLSGGYLWVRPSAWFPYTSIGLEYSGTPKHRLTGLIADYNDLEEINHRYQYEVIQQNIRLVNKINIYNWHGWMPFIQLGLGGTRTKYNQYREISLPNLPSQHDDPKFSQETTFSFAYHASLGIDYMLNKRVWAGLSYRFDDFGKGQTGDAREGIFLKGHIKNYIQAHTVLFSLRYVFN